MIRLQGAGNDVGTGTLLFKSRPVSVMVRTGLFVVDVQQDHCNTLCVRIKESIFFIRVEVSKVVDHSLYTFPSDGKSKGVQAERHIVVPPIQKRP